jgi:hypothetical protein
LHVSRIIEAAVQAGQSNSWIEVPGADPFVQPTIKP